ncbi:MAG: histidine kinase [Saprospirales bacterium]|nr:histidine kinase [Saprospirales bacterium]
MLQTLLSGRARMVTHLVGWALVSLLFFSLLSGIRGAEEAFWRTAVNLLFLVVLFYGNAKVLVNRYLETGRYQQLAGLTLFVWLGTAALRTVVEIRLFGGSIFQGNAMPEDSGVRMFLAYSLSYFLLLLFSTLYQLLENRHSLELRHRALEARHAETQLNYLKAQINPHFLFNTLNNIYAAASLQHPRTADMVLRLSDLLRYVTYDGQQNLVPLGKELAQIRAYLDLFRLKSEQLPAIELEVDDRFDQRQIEPVLLLPLVENALKHGDLDENPGAFLQITLKNTAEALQLTVTNTFDVQNRQKDAAGGVGLENLRQRLELLYPGRHHLTTCSENGIFTAVMEVG